MSLFKIIEPATTTNMVLNPSAETTGNFGDVAGGTTIAATPDTFFGLYEYVCAIVGADDGASFVLGALANAIHYVSFWSDTASATTLEVALDGANRNAVTALQTVGTFTRYGVQISAAQSNGSVSLEITQSSAPAGFFHVDGIQVEEATVASTYCDGDQPGCEWNGAEHASTSTRSAVSRDGGSISDLTDDLFFHLSTLPGGGTHQVQNHLQGLALLPGALWQGVKVQPRTFALNGWLDGRNSRSNWNTRNDALIRALLDDLGQPTLIQYSGGDSVKEIAARYVGAMDAGTSQAFCTQMSIRMIAEDPYWYALGEDKAILDTNDAMTVRYIVGRIDGAWNRVGPPTNGGTVNALALDEKNGILYIGGNFADWDADGDDDDIVQWDLEAETYSPMGTGADDGIVLTLAVGPDGDLYAGGTFSGMGGVGNTAYIARWDGAAWNALGTGMQSTVNALAFDANGLLYAGGNFNAAGGVANTARIASWDGTTWAKVSDGAHDGVDDGSVVALVFEPVAQEIYAGGTFSAVDNGTTATKFAWWDGTSWEGLTGTTDNTIHAVEAVGDGGVYAGGEFTEIGGITAAKVAVWNGNTFAPLGTGMDDAVYDLKVAPDGILYASGVFTEAGGLSLANALARWNGYTWAHTDIELPGSPTVDAIAISKSDPVIPSNYDTYFGFDTTGAAAVSGTTTVTNTGNAIFLPIITFERTGGTSATIATLRNETTGKEMLFNYALLDGEKLTVDLRRGEQTIISNFFGSRPSALLTNSDFSNWIGIPGANTVTAFLIVTGEPLIEAAIRWRTTYKGFSD